jgi:hypothetical protein
MVLAFQVVDDQRVLCSCIPITVISLLAMQGCRCLCDALELYTRCCTNSIQRIQVTAKCRAVFKERQQLQ